MAEEVKAVEKTPEPKADKKQIAKKHRNRILAIANNMTNERKKQNLINRVLRNK